MSRARAAYMRDYRARQKDKRVDDVRNVLRDLERTKPQSGSDFAARRIAELEEEVRHLKAELAKRLPEGDYVITRMSDVPDGADLHPFNSRPFTPVPKKGT